jgi:hypothetical protein
MPAQLFILAVVDSLQLHRIQFKGRIDIAARSSTAERITVSGEADVAIDDSISP